jgi:hypothetical protein
VDDIVDEVGGKERRGLSAGLLADAYG